MKDIVLGILRRFLSPIIKTPNEQNDSIGVIPLEDHEIPMEVSFNVKDTEKYTLSFRNTDVSIIPIYEFYEMCIFPQKGNISADSTDTKSENIKNIDNECPICLGPFVCKNSSEIVIFLHKHNKNVPHCFHYNCIKRSIYGDKVKIPFCPMCRERISLKGAEYKRMMMESRFKELLENLKNESKDEIGPFFLEWNIPVGVLEKIIKILEEEKSPENLELLNLIRDSKEIKEGNKHKALKYQILDGFSILTPEEITTKDILDELFEHKSETREAKKFGELLTLRKKELIDGVNKMDSVNMARFLIDFSTRIDLFLVSFDLIINSLFITDEERSAAIQTALNEEILFDANRDKTKIANQNTVRNEDSIDRMKKFIGEISLLNRHKNDILKFFEESSLGELAWSSDKRSPMKMIQRVLYIVIYSDSYGYFKESFKRLYNNIHIKGIDMNNTVESDSYTANLSNDDGPLKEFMSKLGENIPIYDRLFILACLDKHTDYNGKLKNMLDSENLFKMSIDDSVEKIRKMKSPSIKDSIRRNTIFYDFLFDELDKNLDKTKIMVESIFKYLDSKNITDEQKGELTMMICQAAYLESNKEISYKFYKEVCMRTRKREGEGTRDLFRDGFFYKCSTLVKDVPSVEELISLFKNLYDSKSIEEAAELLEYSSNSKLNKDSVNSQLDKNSENSVNSQSKSGKSILGYPQVFFGLFDRLTWSDKKTVLDEVIRHMMKINPNKYSNRNKTVEILSEKFIDSKIEIKELDGEETVIALMDSIDIENYMKDELFKDRMFSSCALFKVAASKEHRFVPLFRLILDLKANTALKVILAYCFYHQNQNEERFLFERMRMMILERKDEEEIGILFGLIRRLSQIEFD